LAKSGKPRSSKGTAIMCAKIAEMKKADDIVLVDLNDIEFAPADYFLICSCDSENQMKAVVDEVLDQCRELGAQKPKIEGVQNAYWIVLDFFDIAFHIMHKDARKFYQLEKIWGDAGFFHIQENRTLKKVKDFDYLA
jgi:ribosome-associated protein